MTEKLPSKKQPAKMYAIQRKSDGKWSRGGSGTPKWGKLPKTWGLGPFKNHLLMYKVDGYSLNVKKARAEIESATRIYWRSVHPDHFTRYKLLHNMLFPYFDCEVVQFSPDTLEVTNRYPADEWTWNNAFKPNYERLGGYGDGRYLEAIKEYCREFGKEFD